MTLILNNDDVKQVLDMKVTTAELDTAYQELAREEAVLEWFLQDIRD